MSPSDGPRADEPAAGDEPVTEDAERAAVPAAGSAEPSDTPTTSDETDTSAEAGTQGGNRRTVVLVSAIAVVVLVVAGVLVYVLTSGDSNDKASGPEVPSIADSGDRSSSARPGTPTGSEPPPIQQSSAAPPAAGDAGAAQSVAEQAASAITSADMNTLTSLSCDPSTVGDEDTFPPDAKVEVVGEPQINGDAASVDVQVTIGDQPPATVPMPLVKQDGRWCIPG